MKYWREILDVKKVKLILLQHPIFANGRDIKSRNIKSENIEKIKSNTNKELIFVEVKTRRSLNYGRPSEAINYIKRQHIYKVAKYYILKNKIKNPKVRFDAIEILLGKTCSINHIKQAF